jgi:hypothetical protein
MITTNEIIGFWLRWFGIVLLFGVMFLLGVGGIGLILLFASIFYDIPTWLIIVFSIPLFPVAYTLEHLFKWHYNPLWWFLNYTTDGDNGADWWLKKKNLKKGRISTFIRWWLRNNAWNFKLLFKPEWDAGQVDVFLKITNTLINPKHRFTNADREDGIYGVHHIYYRINGKVYGRYSRANAKREFQIGVNGDRYKLIIKN